MNAGDYQKWLGIASKFSARKAEAEDLLQNSLLIAAQAGRLDLEEETNRKWLTGVIKKQALMTARTEGRRRKRETQTGAIDSRQEATEMPLKFLGELPQSARTLATLIIHGMTKEELTHALALTQTAFRQRLVTIRKILKEHDDTWHLAESETRKMAQDIDLGLVRQSLLTYLRHAHGVGTHDPDGHLIVIQKKTTSQIDPPRQR